MTRVVRAGASVSPLVKAGTDTWRSLKGIDVTLAGWIRGASVEMGEATGADPSYLKGHRTPSCTSKLGRGIRTPSPQKEAEESPSSPPLQYCNGRTLQLKDTKYPITS